MITAKIIADSKNQFGNRITTMIVTFPRYILAEFNTHRMLSKNSASSRAIPARKIIEAVKENPFIPIAWQEDHSGMQGTKYITNEEHLKTIKQDWLEARDAALKFAGRLNEGFYSAEKGIEPADKVTKQLCNRLLEAYMYHTVIVTATEWENFFALRCPKYLDNMLDGTPNLKDKPFRSRKDYSDYVTDGGKMMDKHRTEVDWLRLNKGQADIHMMATAEAMWDAYMESVPKELKDGEWHIPFGDGINESEIIDMMMDIQQAHSISEVETMNQYKIKIATARCARVSYTVVGEEGKTHDYEADIKLHDRLSESGHWSPFEHCAKAMSESEAFDTSDFHSAPRPIFSGNFKGFIQYRKLFKNENIEVPKLESPENKGDGVAHL